MSEIADLTVKEALALLEKDNVSSELLEQALLDKRKGIANFFSKIAKNKQLSAALRIIELYRQHGIYFATETHDQVANGTWIIDDRGTAKPDVNESHDYSQLFPKRYTITSYVSWPDKQLEDIDDLRFSCDNLTDLVLVLASWLPTFLPYKEVTAQKRDKND